VDQQRDKPGFGWTKIANGAALGRDHLLERHMDIDLRDLNFGAPAAERDINVGLTDYFVESDAYRRTSATVTCPGFSDQS